MTYDGLATATGVSLTEVDDLVVFGEMGPQWRVSFLDQFGPKALYTASSSSSIRYLFIYGG